MDDRVTDLDFRPKPTAARPLLGLTVLVVEDSRFASEALRLLCLRSGARIRRADCLTSARRHLAVYRPSVAIIDLGLPDGSGLDLIAEIATSQPKVPAILATSGAEREAAATAATAAGADGFLPKPMETIAFFQSEILRHLPEDLRPNGPRPSVSDRVQPDTLAYREDLTHAMDLLELDTPPMAYLRPFLLGVARAAHDKGLEDIVTRATAPLAQSDRSNLRALLSDRIQHVAAV
ncbi:response regulator [Rhodophyticola sp. CCM32]|uniref:response regulator n=1 Tax=Rhodophyticola sp. CCM32 TaxID=2916397 RepID=UPI00107F9E70|nr:response regulator [Rhodophyticola sp. CCM32]QBY01088.1 response regulator [Rhodophyticola sp. CCM32]